MPSLTEILTFTVLGLVVGSAYAIAASGLVITYATSNVFNMAHGSIGMFMAFVYWELAVNRNLPVLLALFLVVGVIAPLFGAIIERTMMRRMTDAPTMVSLTVTVGLMVALIGAAQAIWPAQGRAVDEFFAGNGITMGQVFVSAHKLVIFAVALVVAGVLYLLLARTRTGVGMRAIVDNRELLALHGAQPARLSMLSWAIGSSLAALAGILLVSEVSLDYIQLTLLVVNAYAAAMVGRLKNLPRTIIGAMILGLLMQYYILFETKIQEAIKLPESIVGLLTGIRAALPTIFLFIVMLLLPLEKLRVGQVAGAAQVRVPSWRRAGIFGLVFVGIIGALAITQTTTNTARLGQSIAYAMIMLTLVLITGYGGDVSLAQLTFAGLGGLIVLKMFGGLVSPVSVLAAGLIVAAIGAVVAIPALRLRGLYLGLGTLAFAFATDKLVFENSTWGFQLGGAGTFKRADVLGFSLKSEPVFVIVMAVIFVVMAFAVLAVRRGRFGRLVLASRDSPAACGTLGLNITTTRVLLFSLSTGLAGAAGAMFGGMFVQAGAPEFAMFQNLPLLLLGVVGGITSITGTLIGGFALGFMPAIQQRFPALVGVAYLGIGIAAIGLGRDPNGIAGLLFRLGRVVTGRRDETPELTDADATEDESEAREEVGLVAAP